jgi:hypothetical protein
MVDKSRISLGLVNISKMECWEWDDKDWFPGQIIDDGYCDLYALVIWKTVYESQCESQFCCINVDRILNPQMFIDPKLYGNILVNYLEWKGYKKGVFENWFLGRVLTTGGNL